MERVNDIFEYEIVQQSRRRAFRCADGYCGALDCEKCHPGYYESEEENENL